MATYIALSAAILLFASSQLAPLSRATESCGSLAEEELIKKRIESLKVNLLAQLGISGIPAPLPENATIPAPANATLEEYGAIVNASKSIEENREKKCVSDDFYAKPVSFFSGSMLLEDLPLPVTKRQAEQQSSPAPDDGSSATKQSSTLASYRINLKNFTLPSELSEITKADLLVHQLRTFPGPGIDIRDSEQFVEIRTVLEERGERYVVEGKYLNVYDEGYKVFDITPAVKIWLDKGIHGNVTLEVVVSCFSSPDCASIINGTSPAVIKFDHSAPGAQQTGTETQPKVMILSRNPLEVARNAKRRKRQIQYGAPEPKKFCKANESMCCLKPLTLNFHTDLGLEFIQHPRTFEANYCDGFCPGIAGTDLSSSTRFQFLRQLEDSPASAVLPCCSGREYRDLEVIMLKDGGSTIAIERLQQVTVTACKCT